jgi:hypothetical protein
VIRAALPAPGRGQQGEKPAEVKGATVALKDAELRKAGWQ